MCVAALEPELCIGHLRSKRMYMCGFVPIILALSCYVSKL